MVKIEFIQQLAELVKEKDLGEITVADGEEVVTIKGKKCQPPLGGMPPPIGAPMSMPMAMPAPVQQTAEVPASGAVSGSVSSGNVVKAPLVGTFYAASAPDKPPFVTVGKRVKKGDVLMIIESMKLMNEVQSDFDGVVEEILVSNGQAVEFDQPIMIIK